MRGDFLRWVSLIKNLRGVILDKEEPSQEKLKWLMKKHRYRNLGLPPSYKPQTPLAFLERDPFCRLWFPSSSIEALSKLLAQKVDLLVSEALLLSMCYLSPLIIVEETFFEKLEPFTVWVLRSPEPLKGGEFIFHLRVASYAMIDFCRRPIGVEEVLQNPKVALPLVEQRKGMAIEDGQRRFWRIKKSDEGRVVCAYFDLLPVLVSLPEEVLGELLQDEWSSLALSLSCGIALGEPS